MNNTQVKSVFPRQYSPSGHDIATFKFLGSINDIKPRLVNDLGVTHAFITQGSYQNRQFIVNRAAQIPVADLVDVKVEIVFDLKYGQSSMSPATFLNLFQRDAYEVIETWAQRSRVTGVRGDRYYAIEEPAINQNWFKTSVDDRPPLNTNAAAEVVGAKESVVFSIDLLLSTMIFYNDRRATACFHHDPLEFIDDLENLSSHLRCIIIGVGLRVTHSELGEFEVAL